MSMTVIDALVVTLGLDASDYKKGQEEVSSGLKKTREDADKTASEMQEKGKQAAEFFSRLRSEALTFIAVMAGAAGIKSFTTNIVSTGTSLGRMSTNLNMSVRDLRAWELAARNAGGTAAGIDAQLKESQNAVAMARRGFLPEGAQEFYLQGGTDIRQFKTGTDYLKARLAIVERIEKTQGISAARYSASRMGLDDSQFNFFRLGASGVSNSVDQFRKLAGYTREDTKHAIELTQKFDLLGDKLQLVGIRVGTALLPYLNKIIDWFTKLADWINTHQDTIDAWVNKAVVSIKAFWKETNAAAQAVGGWKNVLIALAGLKILSMLRPLGLLASALFGIGRALGLISAGSGAVGVLTSAAGVAYLGGAAALAYSKNLNSGEQAQLDAIHKKPTNPKTQNDAVRYFMTKGWSEAQAIGIVANLQAESGMDPKALGDNGKAYGMAQWHVDRQDQFKEIYGFDIRKANAVQQLDYVDWELRHSEKSRAGKRLMAARTPQEAAAIVSRYYERPRDADGEAARRAAAAGALYGRVDLAGGSRWRVGQYLPINANNTLDVASGRYTSAPITNNSEVNISGPITINTQATDAKGIAVGLRDHLQSNLLATQANTGLQ